MALVDNSWLNGNFSSQETEQAGSVGTTGYSQSAIGEAVTDFGIKAGMKAAGISSPTIRGVLDDAEDGKFDAAKTGINAATEGLSRALGGYSGLIGGVLNAGYTGVMEGPEAAAKSAIKTGLGITGAMAGSLFGPIGAKFGGWGGSRLAGLAISSFEDGGIGDALDARSHERARDSAENAGWSTSQTAEMAAMDNSPYGNARTKSGYSLSPSLSSQDKYGKFGQAVMDSWGNESDNDNGGGMGVGDDGDAEGHSGSGAGMGPGL